MSCCVPGQGDLVELPGGAFLMGSDDPDANPLDGESPARRVEVAPFAISRVAVTNERFAAFVAATGYVTEAERYGWSFVFAGFLDPGDRERFGTPEAAPWWRAVSGAMWRQPEGPGSDVRARCDHPAVHVSREDAEAFCAWSGTRLPTESEWEVAARGGLEQCRFPWGDALTPDGAWRCNIWQGEFPNRDDAEDGHRGTAPVTAHGPQNAFGLFGIVGNVWEWTSGRFADAPVMSAIRGGSYLCHESYCNRYRVSARTGITPDSSTGNLGFRVARSTDPGRYRTSPIHRSC